MVLLGKREPKLELISKITNALRIPIQEFFLFEDTDNMRMIEPPRYVPLISWTHGGKFTEKNDIEHVGIGEPVPYYGSDPNAFALIVEGDSMEPEFHAGERIIVSPNAHINNGNYCIVEMNGEASLKKIAFRGDMVILKSLNVKYEDVYLNKTEESSGCSGAW